jgi:integrase/recombinase XerC
MDLTDLLAAYIQAKQAEKLKPNTIASYRATLRLFLASLPPGRRVLELLTVADIAAFLAAESARGMGVSTCRARHRALDVWFNWISDIYDHPNVMRRRDGRLRLKAPRKPRHRPRRANLDDLKTVIASIPLDNWVGLRDRAMLLLALDTGLRIAELCDLDCDDLDTGALLVTVRNGKGDKERLQPITPETAQALALYLISRPEIDPKFGYVSKLFWASYLALDQGARGPMGVNGAQKRLAKLCKEAGVNHINWHSIRHLFGTKAINDGLRAETVSLLMGHSDIAFTRRTYAELLPETVIAEYQKTWKRAA